jgi:DnaJ family protein C protein 28
MSKVEEHIRRAIEAGEFSNLRGAGQPLNLDENPFEDPEWRNAFRVLKNSGYTLPWIEARREIDVSLEMARNELRRTWEWRIGVSSTNEVSVDVEWNRALTKFREEISTINERILLYNLEVPSDRFQMPTLDGEREIKLTTTRPSDTLPDGMTE